MYSKNILSLFIAFLFIGSVNISVFGSGEQIQNELLVNGHREFNTANLDELIQFVDMTDSSDVSPQYPALIKAKILLQNTFVNLILGKVDKAKEYSEECIKAADYAISLSPSSVVSVLLCPFSVV